MSSLSSLPNVQAASRPYRPGHRRRFSVPPVLRAMFRNIAIESGLSDRAIVDSISPRVPLQTFARFRLSAPTSVTADQLLMIARFVESQQIADAADVIRMMRDPQYRPDGLAHAALICRSYSRVGKDPMALARRIEAPIRDARRVYLFDRANSFGYLQSMSEWGADTDVTSDLPFDPSTTEWRPSSGFFRYERRPRVFVALTSGSLEERVRCDGDVAIEHLIGHVDSGEQSLVIVDDSPRLAHRIFRGIFAHAQAVAIFDRAAMVVLPKHERSFRLYESSEGDEQARLIADSIRCFHRLRKFRRHAPNVEDVTRLLRRLLTYEVPGHAA